jgi:hypothetical protein
MQIRITDDAPFDDPALFSLFELLSCDERYSCSICCSPLSAEDIRALESRSVNDGPQHFICSWCACVSKVSRDA